MTMFPCINTLFTVNLDRDIRTGDRAQGTPCAFFSLFLKAYRTVSPGIVFMGGDDQPFFACLNAKMAFLAKLPVDGDMSFQWVFLLTIATDHSAGNRLSAPSICNFPPG
jgi:hypothetical protein